jgi:hypothetical protein
MDLSGYWQENKRFVLYVGAGVVLFFIGFVLESSIYGDDLTSTRAEIARLKRQLSEAPYDSEDLAQVERENAALRAAVERLSDEARFRPWPEFVIDPGAGPAANQYLRTQARVREELEQRANRAGLELDRSLGLPELSPTVEAEIVRYLEALDLVESVADLAIRARVDRIDRIQVKLDPGLSARTGLGPIERTRVSFTMTGDALALARVLVWTQRPPGQAGRVLSIDALEMLNARGKRGEVRLDLTCTLARLRDEPAGEAGG